jgi:signal transduction histidine kinase
MGAPPPPSRSLSNPMLIGFLLAGCVALAMVAATQWLAWQERRAAEWVIEGQQALQVIADTRAALVDVQNGHRGFTIEGTTESLQPYLKGTVELARDAARLRQLLQDTPQQQAQLAEFQRLLPARLASAAQIVAVRRSGGFEAARQLVANGSSAREMTQLRELLDGMERQQELVFRDRARQQNALLTRLATWVGAVTLLLLPVLGLLYTQMRRRRAAHDANAELARAQLRLQQLAASMVEHQEQERGHLAYELHEDMAQSMSAIRIDLVRAQRGADTGKSLEDAIALVDALIAQTRDMVARLRPTLLDALGLPEALEGELAWHARRNAWSTQLQVQPEEFPALPPRIATACFRIAQEAISNVARHAHAAGVTVALRVQGARLELSVEDDGVGFEMEQLEGSDLDAERFGLAFMRERARQVGATVDIARGSGGRGVRVALAVPLAA